MSCQKLKREIWPKRPKVLCCHHRRARGRGDRGKANVRSEPWSAPTPLQRQQSKQRNLLKQCSKDRKNTSPNSMLSHDRPSPFSTPHHVIAHAHVFAGIPVVFLVCRWRHRRRMDQLNSRERFLDYNPTDLHAEHVGDSTLQVCARDSFLQVCARGTIHQCLLYSEVGSIGVSTDTCTLQFRFCVKQCISNAFDMVERYETVRNKMSAFE